MYFHCVTSNVTPQYTMKHVYVIGYFYQQYFKKKSCGENLKNSSDNNKAQSIKQREVQSSLF